MLVLWCFVLIILGAVGIIKDLLITIIGIYDYIFNLAIMFVALGILFNSYRKSKCGKRERLEDRIKELEEQLAQKQ